MPTSTNTGLTRPPVQILTPTHRQLAPVPVVREHQSTEIVSVLDRNRQLACVFSGGHSFISFNLGLFPPARKETAVSHISYIPLPRSLGRLTRLLLHSRNTRPVWMSIKSSQTHYLAVRFSPGWTGHNLALTTVPDLATRTNAEQQLQQAAEQNFVSGRQDLVVITTADRPVVGISFGPLQGACK